MEFVIARSCRSWGDDLLGLRQSIDRVPDFLTRPCRGVSTVPLSDCPVPGEWLIPVGVSDQRVLLYLHGGAWVAGSPRAARAYASKLARACGVRVLSLDYRLAPEHPFPAALDDCVAACRWLAQTGVPTDRVVVIGESSGGNLALALLIALRDAGEPLPAGCVGISPITDLPSSMASDPFLARTAEAYVAQADPADPHASPARAELSELPPILLHAGGKEVLVEQIVSFGERAAASGVQAESVVWPGMFHVFQMSGSFVPEARRANTQITEFIRSRLA